MPKVVLLVAVVIAAPTPGAAVNNSYLPGDAFFHTLIASGTGQALAESRVAEFGYLPFHDLMLCGFAGFRTLQVSGLPRSFAQNLTKVYPHVKKAAGVRAREIWEPFSGYNMLLYNESFDWKKRRLCLRYNERWHKLTSHLTPFVNTAKAVIDDWRTAEFVKPFDVRCPKPLPNQKDIIFGVGERPGPPGYPKKPIVWTGKKIRAIILPTPRFADYYSRKKDAIVFEVTANAINEYKSDGCKWVLTRRIR